MQSLWFLVIRSSEISTVIFTQMVLLPIQCLARHVLSVGTCFAFPPDNFVKSNVLSDTVPARRPEITLHPNIFCQINSHTWHVPSILLWSAHHSNDMYRVRRLTWHVPAKLSASLSIPTSSAECNVLPDTVLADTSDCISIRLYHGARCLTQHGPSEIVWIACQSNLCRVISSTYRVPVQLHLRKSVCKYGTNKHILQTKK